MKFRVKTPTAPDPEPGPVGNSKKRIAQILSEYPDRFVIKRQYDKISDLYRYRLSTYQYGAWYVTEATEWTNLEALDAGLDSLADTMTRKIIEHGWHIETEIVDL